MRRNRRPSEQTLTVLLVLAADPARWHHGYDLCRQTSFKAGTVYPILMRLADRGWLETSWETPGIAGRPPRHLYRVTKAGLESARQLQSEMSGELRTRPARLRPRLERST